MLSTPPPPSQGCRRRSGSCCGHSCRTTTSATPPTLSLPGTMNGTHGWLPRDACLFGALFSLPLNSRASSTQRRRYRFSECADTLNRSTIGTPASQYRLVERFCVVFFYVPTRRNARKTCFRDGWWFAAWGKHFVECMYAGGRSHKSGEKKVRTKSMDVLSNHHATGFFMLMSTGL